MLAANVFIRFTRLLMICVDNRRTVHSEAAFSHLILTVKLTEIKSEEKSYKKFLRMVSHS